MVDVDRDAVIAHVQAVAADFHGLELVDLLPEIIDSVIAHGGTPVVTDGDISLRWPLHGPPVPVLLLYLNEYTSLELNLYRQGPNATITAELERRLVRALPQTGSALPGSGSARAPCPPTPAPTDPTVPAIPAQDTKPDRRPAVPLSPTTTIDEALETFLADQRERLSARTLRNYEDVIDLLRHCLNGYGPNALDEPDRKRWEEAYKDDEEAFCHLFGPEYILSEVDEFLGYFMVRKVMAGQDLLRSAGTVTKKLANWLHEHGHAGEGERDLAVDRGTTASRDLPRAERLANLLYEQSLATAAVTRAALSPSDIVGQDLPLRIERVEPGKLYFTGIDGPLHVPRETTDLAKPGWDVTITLIRQRGTWKVLEVGNVYPH